VAVEPQEAISLVAKSRQVTLEPASLFSVRVAQPCRDTVIKCGLHCDTSHGQSAIGREGTKGAGPVPFEFCGREICKRGQQGDGKSDTYCGARLKVQPCQETTSE
jgi:hypothetical protein